MSTPCTSQYILSPTRLYSEPQPTNVLVTQVLCYTHVSADTMYLSKGAFQAASPYSRHISVGGMVITVHLLRGNTIHNLSLYNSGLNYCHKKAP